MGATVRAIEMAAAAAVTDAGADAEAGGEGAIAPPAGPDGGDAADRRGGEREEGGDASGGEPEFDDAWPDPASETKAQYRRRCVRAMRAHEAAWLDREIWANPEPPASARLLREMDPEQAWIDAEVLDAVATGARHPIYPWRA